MLELFHRVCSSEHGIAPEIRDLLSDQFGRLWIRASRAPVSLATRILKSSAWFSALLAAWMYVVAVIEIRQAPVTADLAEYLNSAVRLLHAELPYRDFWLVHPPGEVLVPAAVLALGGEIGGVLLTGVLISVLTATTAFRIVRLITESNWAGGSAAALVYFAGVPANYGGYGYLHAHLPCLFAGAELLVRWLGRRDGWALFWSGVAIGLGACFRLYLAGAAATAVSIILWLESRKDRRTLAETVCWSMQFVSGIALFPFLMTVCLWSIAPEMWRAIALDSFSHATTLRPIYGHQIGELGSECVARIGHCIQFPDQVRRLAEALDVTSRLAAATVAHLLPVFLLLLGLSLRSCRGNRRTTVDWATLFLLIWGGITFIRSVTRGGAPSQLSQSTTPWSLALVVLGWQAIKQHRALRTRASRWVAATALIALLGLGQTAIIKTVDSLFLRGTPPYVVAARGGRLSFEDAERAFETQGLVDAIERETKLGESVFVTPDEAPPVYALTGRRNPTRFDSLIDLMYRPTAEKQRQVCQALLNNQTRLVIHRPGAEFGGNAAIGSLEARCPQIAECLEMHYEPYQTIGRFTLYRLRDQPNGGDVSPALRTESVWENTVR